MNQCGMRAGAINKNWWLAFNLTTRLKTCCIRARVSDFFFFCWVLAQLRMHRLLRGGGPTVHSYAVQVDGHLM